MVFDTTVDKIFKFAIMAFDSADMVFDTTVDKIFKFAIMAFDSTDMVFVATVAKKFDLCIDKKFDPAVAMIFDPAIVMIFDHVCINLDHVAPDKAKFSSTKSQLLFTFTAPDTRGLRLKDMHLLILWSFDQGLWQSTSNT
jgi:hypothetical protein